MIWESSYWKSDLVKDAEKMIQWSQRKYSEQRDVLLEKRIFISAYSIRKLIEAEKIGPDFPKWNLAIIKYIKTNSEKNITYINWHKIDKFYALDRPEKGSLNIEFLSNLLIHSFIFILGITEKGCVDCFYITSDKDKDKFLYKVNLDQFITMLQNVGYSDVIELSLTAEAQGRYGFKIPIKYSVTTLKK